MITNHNSGGGGGGKLDMITSISRTKLDFAFFSKNENFRFFFWEKSKWEIFPNKDNLEIHKIRQSLTE